MSNPEQNSERRQQILDAALEVFSTKGFTKATNKDIAQAAGGISPGLIYWYFKDKNDLFFSLIRERATILSIADHPEQLLSLPLRDGLTFIARSYLNIFQLSDASAFFRMILGEFVHFPQVGEMFYQLLADRLFNLIRTYLQQYVDSGVLRPHNTATSARTFVGMLLVQVMARELMRQPDALETADEEIVTTVVDIFLHGLETPTGTANA